ncbi:phosphotransferase family protein [Virgibacillus sediminis]|uniref:Phosphotransferase family protein n=1 Tax=Virgibacillus sediminis TaxID=202260 RepID=A0ABV7A5H9_9BACI
MKREKTVHAIDWANVEKYLRAHIEGLPDREMRVQKFTEGFSNLTYMIQIGDWKAVLRRPPFGYIPPKAHDMQREYRILEKIHPVYPYAPKPYIYSEDDEIMDKHFYLMEKKDGVVVDREIPEEFGNYPDVGKQMSEAIIAALSQLQNIDVKEAGLESLGKPDGYVERQVVGWKKRLDRAKTSGLRNVEDLEKWLADNIPENNKVSVIHNDFKLNNMMFDRDDPGKIIGVFDWEMATIGDPLTDLGSTLAYWSGEGDPYTGISSITSMPGFYSRREFLERYTKVSGMDVSNMDFYLTFGFYKLAGIMQQLYHRWEIGEVKDDRFSTLQQGVNNLIEMAEEAKDNKLL